MRWPFGRFGHTCGLSSWQEFVQYAQRNRLQMYIRYTGKPVCKNSSYCRKKAAQTLRSGRLVFGDFFSPMDGRGYRMRIVSVFVSVFA